MKIYSNDSAKLATKIELIHYSSAVAVFDASLHRLSVKVAAEHLRYIIIELLWD